MRDSRRYPSLPMVGAGAVVHKDGHVLLIRRKYPPNAGRWAIPGGLVELGETTSAAAAREVKEETGLSVRIERLLDVGTDLHRDEGSRIEYHFVLVDYSAVPVAGRLKLNSESSAWGWFSEEKTRRMDMSRGTRAVIRKYYETSRAGQKRR